MEEHAEDTTTSNRPKKTGPKPKELIKVEVMGYEVGRGKTKRIVFDNDVFKLAAMGCTDREIANWFDMSESTLRYNFSSILEKARVDLKQSLRQAQLKLALSGNAVMLIWLGKNILGQSDTPNSNDNNQILPYTDDDSCIIEEDVKDTEDV
jgi:DNA-binding CsgD family transcriptional regulator